MYTPDTQKEYKEKICKGRECRERPLIWRAEKCCSVYTGADKSLGRPGRKQSTATEDFEFHISYL